LATTYAAVSSVHKLIIIITIIMAIKALKTPQPATMMPIIQTGVIAGTMDFATMANPEEAIEGAIEEATTAVTAVARNATFAASKAAGRFVIKLTRKKMHISVFML
jgi:histidinol phosphatase-like enzyme